MARIGVLILTVLLALMAAPGLAADREATLREDEEGVALMAADDDGDDDNTGNTGGGDGTGNSNDGTNSRHTGVSRDRDRSRGDLTRDRTKDGPGGGKRDWSQNGTNDRTRNDTR
jgi:hypothetical protein